MRTSHVIMLGTCLALGCVLTGCTTAISMENPKASYKLERKWNTWTAVVQKPLPVVHAAILAGLKELEVKPITNQADKVSATVDGLFADQMDFAYKLDAITTEATRVTIHAGVTGDSTRAQLLFRTMEKHLP